MSKTPTKSGKTSTRSGSMSQTSGRPAPEPVVAPPGGFPPNQPGQTPHSFSPTGVPLGPDGLPIPPSVTAIETSSRVKRQRVLDVVLPMGTSARMAEAARASVWAISSEKTTLQFQAAEAAADKAEEARTETLVVVSTKGMDEERRHSARDVFSFLREELDRPDDESADPHALWRKAYKRLRHELQPGPGTDALERLEERLNVKFPPSFYDFSLEWGGGLLYVHEYGAIRIVPALEILDELKGPLAGRMNRPFLPVVDLGCGDYLALDMGAEGKGGEKPLVWWHNGEVRKKVAESFGAWLRKLVEAQGQPYWWS